MAGKREAKREEFRARLVEAASARIARSGLKGLRARDVTGDTASALGGLYNAFADLDDLVLHVNSATLGRLRALARTRAERAQGPHETLEALALAYLAFARDNHALWSALFEHRLAPERPLPDWHRAEQATLIQTIAVPLRELAPDLSEDALLVRARTLFAAIHGVVAIALENRFVGVPEADLEGELRSFVDVIVRGMEATRPGNTG